MLRSLRSLNLPVKILDSGSKWSSLNLQNKNWVQLWKVAVKISRKSAGSLFWLKMVIGWRMWAPSLKKKIRFSCSRLTSLLRLCRVRNSSSICRKCWKTSWNWSKSSGTTKSTMSLRKLNASKNSLKRRLSLLMKVYAQIWRTRIKICRSRSQIYVTTSQILSFEPRETANKLFRQKMLKSF